MRDIRAADLRGVVTGLGELAALDAEGATFDSLARAMMEIILRLVPADTINLGLIDHRSGRGSYFAYRGFLMPKSRRALLPRYVDDHPMLAYSKKTGKGPPLQFTDFMSRSNFERTPLYNECYRGYTHGMMTFMLPSPRNINCSFVLSRQDRDFSERDRQILTVLQPQLAVHYRASIVRAESLARTATSFTGPTDCGVVIAGDDGFIRTINHQAYSLLDAFIGTEFSAHRLPVQVRDHLDKAAVRGQSGYTPLELAGPGKTEPLILRPARLVEGWAILIQERGSDATSLLRKHGLTRKEIEVLGWVAEGKSDKEIAAILGSSSRTVQKHVQNLMNRLHAENRVAALARARELIGQDTIIPRVG
ncbi:MAG: helix-turn-helix transcriptional regulator [Opitutaceae bacterium]